MKLLSVLILFLLLSACGDKSNTSQNIKIEGVFSSIDGKSRYVFDADGVVHFGSKKTEYHVIDNVIKFQFDGGMPVAFVKNADGSISFNGVEKFKKID
jgi:hypothetical protein